MTTALISKSISRQNRNSTSPNSVNSTRITLKKRERERRKGKEWGERRERKTDAFASLIIKVGLSGREVAS